MGQETHNQDLRGGSSLVDPFTFVSVPSLAEHLNQLGKAACCLFPFSLRVE